MDESTNNNKFAPGIPSKEEFGNIEDLSPSDIAKLVVQKHIARKAGKHYDIRIGTEKSNLISFATKKEPPLPPPKSESGGIFTKRLLVRQPLHEYSYKDFEGKIESGYGAGDVEKILEENVLVSDISKDKILFTTMGRYPERFLLFRPKKFGVDQWILMNITPTEYPPEKRKYITIEHDKIDKELEKLTDADTIEVKVDGALGVFNILKDKIEILSHRKSKRVNRPILYTEKFFGVFPKLKEAKKFDDTIFLGEIFAVKVDEEDGSETPVSPSELSGILNSTLENALKYIKDNNIKFKAYVFDVLRYKGRDIDWSEVPYRERLKLVESLVNELNKDFRDGKKFMPPIYVFGKDKGKELWERLKNDKDFSDALYKDGIVIWPELGRPKKIKFHDEVDVYIRQIIPEERTTEERAEMAGKILWSFTPDGPIVGVVGTGMDHALKEDMLKHPEEYIGRVMRVKFLEKTKKGRLRNPVFIAMHEEKTAGFEIKLNDIKLALWNINDLTKFLNN